MSTHQPLPLKYRKRPPLLQGLGKAVTQALPAIETAHRDLKDELTLWWLDQARAEIDMVVDKAIEYGATDLVDIGHQLARTAGRTICDQDAAEWGIAFYALGKVSRILAAIAEGRQPSEDSWLDLGVYARMAQRVKQCGGWPGDPIQADARQLLQEQED